MKLSSRVVGALRAPMAWLFWSTLAWLALQASAAAASDYIFANGFQAVGYPIPLTSPEGPDNGYTALVSVGDQQFALDFDTGSAALAVAGTSCTTCANVSPVYTPSASATPTGNTASSQYSDGTSWSGPIYLDAVDLGGGSPSVGLDLVDITKANQFFDPGNAYQGIIGMAPLALVPNTTAYMPTAVSAGLDDILSFDLCDNTGSNAGTLWLGGDGSPVSAQYTPLVPISSSNNFYAINVDGLSLGDTIIASNASATFQQPVLDTGTSLFYVPTSVFNAFKTALQASAGFKALFGNSTFSFEGCVAGTGVTDAEVESQLPAITLALPNMSNGQPDITIQAAALDTYLFNPGDGTYCLAVQDGGTADPSTFGDAFLQAFHVVIDAAGGRVGFAPQTTCTAAAGLQPVARPAQNGPHRPKRPRRA